jgi:hypothetical protein
MSNERIEATAKVNGAELFYEIDGAGEPLQLLHGGTASDWYFRLETWRQSKRAR